MLPGHDLGTLAIAPAAEAPIQLARTKEGKAGRRDKRRKQRNHVFKSGRKLGLTGSDYIVTPSGQTRRAMPGKATANLFNRARSLRPRSDALPLDFTSLPGRAASVMSLAASFVADRDEGVNVTRTGQEDFGSLTRSNMARYSIPDDAYSHPGEPSAFASPLDSGGTKIATTYQNNAGVFSGAHFGATDERTHAQRTLISAAESVRGAGAGLAQVIAEDVRGNGSVDSRNKMYGTKAGPGYLPGGYVGSQNDIVLTDDRASEHDYEGLLANPTGLQTERVLADERRNRVGKLERSLSNPELNATEEDHARDSDGLFRRMGLSLEHQDREKDRALKRGRSLI